MPIVITDLDHDDEDFDLDPDVIASLWEMENRHFWHAARNRWLAKALHGRGLAPGARFLDVGCGSGAVAGFLDRSGYRVVGVDTAEPLLRKAHERCPHVTFVVGRVARLPVGGRPFDAAGLFDVLEHLDDPEQLLRDAMQYVKPGGLVIATVPAMRSLHSVIDDLSGHKRRYEPGELASLLQRTGLREVEERGIFRSTTPIVRLTRPKMPLDTLSAEQRRKIAVANLRVPHPVVNRTLGFVCSAERAIGFRRATGRGGGSLLAVGRV